MAGLDDIDWRLVEALSVDGRAGLGDLGKQVGLSGDAVRERLRRLRDGQILSITGTPDPGALGYHTVALVGIRVRGPVLPVATRVGSVPEVDFLTCTIGEFDILAEVLARDDEHLLNLLDERVRAIPEVEACVAFQYLNAIKWTPGGLALPSSGNSDQPIELDADDRRLLAQLQRDGRASFRDLAMATDLPYTNARRRTRALIDSGAVRIVTTVNRIAIGTAVMAAVALQVNGPVSKVIDAIRGFDEVEVAFQATGTFDVVLEVACRDRAHLLAFAADDLRGVPGIDHCQTFPYIRLLKLPVQWSAGAVADTVSGAN